MTSGELLRVDGAFGEGGGQVLRTGIAFSAVLGRPIEVVNIRAKRETPGLKPQHVSAVRAVASLCDATVENLRVGASWIRFAPKRVSGGELKLDVGSAGSITLVLQAVFLALGLSGASGDFEIVGGTDVKWSPTVNYFRSVVLPAYEFIGVKAELTTVRRGYYPRGGGVVQGRVVSSTGINPLNLTSAPVVMPSVVSVCSNLPRSVAERQLTSAVNYLFRQGVKCVDLEVAVEEAVSPGSSILVYAVGRGGPFLGADSLGERGKPAEQVGREAAQAFMQEFRVGAPLDRHVGDMLVAFLAASDGESRLRVASVTPHLATNLYVASLFTGCRYRVEEQADGSALVIVEGRRLVRG